MKPGTNPLYQSPRRAGPTQRETIGMEIQKLREQKCIEPASSEWASPIVMVLKSFRTARFCAYYRKLYSVTVKDNYPLPLMKDCLQSLGDALYSSALDFNSGYGQIAVVEEEKGKTSLPCHEGLFRWIRMPMGLTNSLLLFSGQ